MALANLAISPMIRCVDLLNSFGDDLPHLVAYNSSDFLTELFSGFHKL
jgi:hypothetical protein